MKIEWTFALNGRWAIDRVLEFVTIANRYTANIHVGRSGKMMNAKGLLGIVSLSLLMGEQSAIVLQVEGPDAQEAFDQVSVYLQQTEAAVSSVYSRSS